MSSRVATWPLAVTLVVAGCGGGDRPGAASETPAADAPADFHNPTSPGMQAQAPATFRARFETSEGDFVVEVHREWAPRGADRFYNLVRSGYFDGVRFFRVLQGFVAQFGIHGDPAVSALWREQRIPDDAVRQTNARGTLTFATAGPNTRTTQLFINYRNNPGLDQSGFAPFGQVVEGIEVVDRLHAGYGEGAPAGRGPDQGRIQAEGNAYLERAFPDLDYVRRAALVTP
jgi:peptidyl-prolyl cis-trans isomerase A (cyclophilin A)